MSNNIVSERKRIGLRQSDLADRLEVSKSTIERWEQGRGLPNADQLIVLHSIFGCSIDYLLGITDERKVRV